MRTDTLPFTVKEYILTLSDDIAAKVEALVRDEFESLNEMVEKSLIGVVERQRAKSRAKDRSIGFHRLARDIGEPSERVQVDLTAAERFVLARGISEWGGPARCTEKMAVAMGFRSVKDLLDTSEDLYSGLENQEPLTRADWVRVLLMTEIVFASDVVGAGREWPITTGTSDSDTISLLRSIQRKIPSRSASWRGQTGSSQ